MKPRFHFSSRLQQRGVALIIVLAFVVLLTGLIVAYFSRAIADRQISTSSASQTRGRLFANGVASSIIDDLRQEIAAGSNVALAGLASSSAQLVFAPVTGAGMVRTRVLKGAGTPANLIKQSVYGTGSNKYFFPNNDAVNYPGGEGAAAVYPPSNRAANVATTTSSLNGRVVSAARWNKPLFLQAKSTADFTPDPAINGDVQVPDWILVTRNGNNPQAWNLNMATLGGKYTGASGDGNVVIGRYAYNVYDEGGLLDANVAGYPSSSTLAHSSNKTALSYADVTQIFTATGATAANAVKILGSTRRLAELCHHAGFGNLPQSRFQRNWNWRRRGQLFQLGFW
ncbi:MAG: hypothetical protein QM796_08670 [Chthoniobacteraceae bacterium]